MNPGDVVTWDYLLDHCSRVYTTRTRVNRPYEPPGRYEDAQPLLINIGERNAVVMPNGHGDPGFSVKSTPGTTPWWLATKKELAWFRTQVDAGHVSVQ